MEDERLDIVEGVDEDGNRLLLRVNRYFYYNGEEYVLLSDDIDEVNDNLDEVTFFVMKVTVSTDEDGEENRQTATESTVSDEEEAGGEADADAAEDGIISVVVPTSVNMSSHYTEDGIALESDNMPVINKGSAPVSVKVSVDPMQKDLVIERIVRSITGTEDSPEATTVPEDAEKMSLDMKLHILGSDGEDECLLPEEGSEDVADISLAAGSSGTEMEDIARTGRPEVTADDYAVIYMDGELHRGDAWVTGRIAVNLRFDFKSQAQSVRDGEAD